MKKEINVSMLRRSMTFIACTLAVAGLTGCGAMLRAPIVPPPGFIYSNIKAPLDYDPNGSGTRVSLGEARVGTAESQYVWVPLNGALSFAWGDVSYKQAAQNGNLSNVAFADYEYFNVLGIYAKTTVHAYGN